jgi:hypothetical protein
MTSEPITIQPEAFYDDWTLSEALGLPLGTIAAARRTGALRYTQKGKRTLYRGSWVLTWLDPPATRKNATSGEGVVHA